MKSSGTESAATDTPRGLESSTESSSTSLPAPMLVPTPSPTRSGDVEIVTAASSTPDRSLLLSGDEGQRLARIARDRANRFMVSGPDVDFLLDVLVRLSR